MDSSLDNSSSCNWGSICRNTILPLSYEVYTRGGYRVATVAHVEAGALLVSALGPGAEIYVKGKGCLWKEGEERQAAAVSLSAVAQVVAQRMSDPFYVELDGS